MTKNFNQIIKFSSHINKNWYPVVLREADYTNSVALACPAQILCKLLYDKCLREKEDNETVLLILSTHKKVLGTSC